MAISDYYFFPEGDPVPDEWVEAPLHLSRCENEEHKKMLAEELAILKAFYHHLITAEKAAYAITRPISDSSVPFVNTYEDDSIALFRLWAWIVKALQQWPASRIPDLVALLDAISKVPDLIYRGETIDDEYKPMGWNILPYFGAM